MSEPIEYAAMQTCQGCNGFPVDDDGLICATCEGIGVVPVPPAVVVPEPAPSLNHGGPGTCTLCHPKGLFA